MKRRLVIITEIISPYRIPLFNALAQHPELNLHVVFLGETDPSLREWRVYKEEIRFSFQVLSSWRRRLGKYNALLNQGLSTALTQSSPQVILCGGYNYLASWQALLWARNRAVPFILWSESNRQDRRRNLATTELLKRQFLQRCDRFVVPGHSALEYLRTYNVPGNLVSIAPNAIDNQLFATTAQSARQSADVCRSALNLPNRYYLFVGRMVREKGVLELLTAYEQLETDLRSQVGLVFVGDGPCKRSLEQRARGILNGDIRFAGFVHREQLGSYYGLAETFVLPTYSDTWGMVVNEAMACGLPIIVSDAAGSAEDLIRENWNGVLVKPGNVDSLRLAMTKLGREGDVRREFGTNSASHILHYSPEAWADSIVNTIRAF